VTSRLGGLLVLNTDVILVPVADLPDETRAQIDHDPGDFALSRPQARTGSKVVDADAAALVSRFNEPRTIAEAVILFARERQLEPTSVLEGAHAFIRGLVDGGFLVSPDAAGASGGHTARFPPGSAILGGTVVRTLAVLEDTELAVLARAGTPPRVLKIGRTGGPGETGAWAMGERLQHEAAYLRHLDGELAPRMFGVGQVDEAPYLEMEHVAGADVGVVAAELRGDRERRADLLDLLGRVVRAYVGLHERGVVHGDVHPRNVLVDGRGRVRLVDFGAATAREPGALPVAPMRGGVPFFFEPEFAASTLAGRRCAASTAGEQYAVAALLWFLAAGDYCQHLRLGREEMLEDIAEGPLRSFADAGAPAWPALERVLARALAKAPGERYGSLAELADAVAAVTPPTVAAPVRSAAASDVVTHAVQQAGPDGSWWQRPTTTAPSASIMYGASGVALGLLHIACRRQDAHILALADLWARRAARLQSAEDAFRNDAIQITPAIVGRVSPYHSASGVPLVEALVAAARGDVAAQRDAVAAFAASTDGQPVGLDLTVGHGSVALGAALIIDAVAQTTDITDVRKRGAAALASVWDTVATLPTIREADIEYAGIAHGWAGFAYAALLWSKVTGAPIHSDLERRLDELAALAIPVGRGLEWPWMLRRGTHTSMPGWCNGTAGFVALWHLAHGMTGKPAYADLAEQAAWHVWEAPEPGNTLCCGGAGRGYALLTHYRHTGDPAWLRRADTLARHAAAEPDTRDDYPHGLYKGAFGAAVLLAELERPDESFMPLFEPSSKAPATATR
jgi:eukaryotic-like serine/threonine-protein kinase